MCHKRASNQFGPLLWNGTASNVASRVPLFGMMSQSDGGRVMARKKPKGKSAAFMMFNVTYEDGSVTSGAPGALGDTPGNTLERSLAALGNNAHPQHPQAAQRPDCTTLGGAQACRHVRSVPEKRRLCEQTCEELHRAQWRAAASLLGPKHAQ